MRSNGRPRALPRCCDVVVLENRGALNLEVETARVPGIVGAVSGPPIFGVVGRRARTDEREAVGIVMGIEKIGQLSRGLRDGERPHHAEHDQTLETRRDGGRSDRDAQGHADPFGLVEVGHPRHAGVDRQLIAARDGRFRVLIRRCGERIRTNGERAQNVLARDADDHPPRGMHHRHPAIGQQPYLRCMAPRLVGLRGHDRRKLNRHGRGRSFRRTRCRTLRHVGRRQHSHDPRGAPRPEAVGELPPRIRTRVRVVARPPVVLPIMLTPGQFVGCEVGFVAVAVNLVGEHAHAQLRRAVRQREETRLESHRQQQQRKIAGTQRRGWRVGARSGNRETGLEESAHGSAGDELRGVNRDAHRQPARDLRHVRGILAPAAALEWHTRRRLRS